MANQFQIKKGLSTNLFDANGKLLITPEEGYWYITTDTFELYACFNGILKAVGGIEDFETRLATLETRTEKIIRTYEEKAQLPKTGELHTLYIVEEDNLSYRWDEDTLSYIALGVEFSVIDGGAAKI